MRLDPAHGCVVRAFPLRLFLVQRLVDVRLESLGFAPELLAGTVRVLRGCSRFLDLALERGDLCLERGVLFVQLRDLRLLRGGHGALHP